MALKLNGIYLTELSRKGYALSFQVRQFEKIDKFYLFLNHDLNNLEFMAHSTY